MASNRSLRSLLVAASLTLVAVAGAGVAQARDVNWSLGISSPGVVVDVDNGRGVRVMPAPVYFAPPPPAPRAIYYPAPVERVYYAPPVYVAPSPVYEYRDRDRGYHNRHRDHDRRHGYGHSYGHGYGHSYGHDNGRHSAWERR